MIDYSKWPRKKIFTTSLKLDDQNPRLPSTITSGAQRQGKIIDYLVEHEHVYELVKTIAVQGYFPNEEPIVCKEEGKYIVLEGNRRVAAAKILLHPDLLHSSTKQKNLSRLLDNFDINQIKRLEVRIAPSREAADVIIVNRHTEGAPIEKWDKTKQDRFFHNRFIGGETIDELSLKFNISKGALKDGLKRFNVYGELLALNIPENIKSKIEDETSFNMTNVERFYNSKPGKEFLNVEFDNAGNVVHHLPKIEYQRRLMIVGEWVVKDKLNSRTFGDEKQQKALINEISKSPGLELSVVPNKKYQAQYSNTGVEALEEEKNPEGLKKTISAGKAVPKNKLMSSDIKWHTGIDRLDKIFREIKAANLNTQFNSAAVLFRSYLDMVVYQYLNNNGSITELIREEQKKRDDENIKRKDRLVNFISSIGVKKELINEKELQKAIRPKTGVSTEWIPSLKHMLSHIAKNEHLLPETKLRSTLGSYVGKNETFLDHNDFNLLVHNEYFIKDGADLKKSFDQMRPIMNYIIQQLSQK
jgi:hypothetical protein